MGLLDKISSPADLRGLDKNDIKELCAEIRDVLVNDVSKTGGHLSSNLGVVELTVAVHLVFDTSKDRLIFDVGHQSYVHKMLTGRLNEMSTLRQFGGLSGFPKPSESVHDAFIAGHASNSISAALGMARARTLRNEDYSVIAVTGDGALTGGLAYEALNDAGESGEPLIVILNDNGMAISPNVGAIAEHLSRLRIRPGYVRFKKAYHRVMDKIPGGKALDRFNHRVKTMIKTAILPCSLFEDMGFQYIGPVDGHDVQRTVDALEAAKNMQVPVIVHVITQKGRGYAPSELHPDKYHGVSKFDPAKGVSDESKQTFADVFGDTMIDLAAKDEKLTAETAAMPTGTGLTGFERRFPERFFNVGIAEGHAMTMAAGMAKQGMHPVVAVYSTFLQRAYDMLIHDVALLRLHVVIGVDRAGIVGSDGDTHQGMFDVAFLSSVPKMTVFCPSSFGELRKMLEVAVMKVEGPVAVRYPRGGEGEYKDVIMSSAFLMEEGSDFTVVSYGININDAISACAILREKGYSADLIKLGVISPVDCRLIAASVAKTKRLLVLEEVARSGCVGERIVCELAEKNVYAQTVILKNLGEEFLTHGTPDELRRAKKLDGASVAEDMLKELTK